MSAIAEQAIARWRSSGVALSEGATEDQLHRLE
jgi:hypothetical protein